MAGERMKIRLLKSEDMLLILCRTSGGKGGATVTVSTLEALESAITGNDPRIVVVSGTISGAKKIFVGSNKSIIGRKGSRSRSLGLPRMAFNAYRNCRHWPLRGECNQRHHPQYRAPVRACNVRGHDHDQILDERLGRPRRLE